MYRFPSTAPWLPVAILLLCSCTHNPRIVSGTESDYLLKLRAEYLLSNPDGQYNEFIKRGEVVKGMDILEVLAAWGTPKLRERNASFSEQWTYRTIDEASKDSYEYIFVFRENLLSEWELTRHFAAGGSVAVPEASGSEGLSRVPVATAGQSEVPKK